MEKILWRPELSLGNPAMDEAHKQLLNEIALLADTPDADLYPQLTSLLSKMEADFKEEEAMMEQINYPEIKTHREHHARVMSALHEIVPEVMRGNFDSPRAVLNLLPEWSVMHILTVDKALLLYRAAVLGVELEAV